MSDITSEQRAEFYLSCRVEIKEHGHMVMAVFGDEDGTPGFAYTVGRVLQNKPELLMIGDLNPKTQTQLLNNICSLQDRDGELKLGRRTDIANVPFYLAEISAQAAIRDYAIGAPIHTDKRPEDFAFVQVVWSDKNSKLPWEEGCEVTHTQQPVLFTQPIEVTDGEEPEDKQESV